MKIKKIPLLLPQKKKKLNIANLLSVSTAKPQMLFSSRLSRESIKIKPLSRSFNSTSRIGSSSKTKNYNDSSDIYSHEIMKLLSMWDKEHIENKNTNCFESFMEDNDTEKFQSKPQSKESTNTSSFIKMNLSNIKIFNQQNSIINSFKLNNNTLIKKEKSSFDFKVFLSSKSMPDISSPRTAMAEKPTIVKPDYSSQLKKEQIKIEASNRDKLMNVYQSIIISKLKKKKYENILDDTYHLIDAAKTEYYLCTDILKERLKSVQKYYEAFREGSHVDEVNKKNEGPYYRREKLSTTRTKKITRKQSFRDNDEDIDEDYNNIEDEETERKKKIKKKTMAEQYEEKIKKYREYLSICEDINKEIKEYDKKFESIKKDLNVIVNTNKAMINKLNTSISNLKISFESLVKEQRDYYMDILKTGTDTRKEGLTWVIKRLLELNVVLEEKDFPSFLTQEHIDYLMLMANLGFECTQLELILNSLKSRQQNALEKKTEDLSKNSTSIGFFALIKDFNSNSPKQKIFEKTSLSKENLDKINNLYKRHEELMKHLMEKKIEDCYIVNYVNSVKKKVNEFFIGKKYSAFDNCSSKEIRYLLEHEKQKEYYDDIIVLKARIAEINRYMMAYMKKTANRVMEKTNYFKKQKNERINDHYDRIYSALFGTTIFL